MLLVSSIQSLIVDFPGTAAIVVRDVKGGESIRISEDIIFPAASIIKLPVLWAFFQAIEDGRLDPGERITLSSYDIVGGSGVLQALDPGLQPTLRDLATLMIISSDNSATNLLIDRLGFTTINDAMTALGLKATVLQRQMMDFERAGQGFDNYTTAADTAGLLALMLQSDRLPAASRRQMIDILKQQQDNSRLTADLPEETPYAHKTGGLPGVDHDAGILYPDERPTIVVVLTQTAAPNRAGRRLCSAIGELVYRS